jgi:hypothetical protein
LLTQLADADHAFVGFGKLVAYLERKR